MRRLVLNTRLLVRPTLASPSPGGSGGSWTISADGTRARLPLRNAYAPAWSPDGSSVVFVSSRSGDEEL